MFDKLCKCGHYKEEHVEKWFSPKEIKCLGGNCSCNKLEIRPTKPAGGRLKLVRVYEESEVEEVSVGEYRLKNRRR